MGYELKLCEIHNNCLLFFAWFQTNWSDRTTSSEGFGNENMSLLKTKLTENKGSQK